MDYEIMVRLQGMHSKLSAVRSCVDSASAFVSENLAECIQSAEGNQ
ncbi:hypothetical protein ACQKMD_19800 [Viridibacillus sp. NPDC096237]